jgi:hypothetical protein
MALLVAAVLAGSGMAAIAARLSRPRAWLLSFLVCAVLVVEYRSPPDLWEAPPPTVAPELGFTRGVVVAEMPIAPPERLDLSVDAAYMVERIGAWPFLINGYSGYHPRPYLELAASVRNFPDERAIRALARAGVTVLTVHEFWYRERFSGVVSALNLRADVERIGEYGGDGRRVAVFQLLKR